MTARRPSGDGLESITSDIARLVDDAAAADIWERWRQGETNAVSRRLYTAAGQQAFEDISRRLRTEPSFRESVDRYLGEFERLLAKIGQNDRDGVRSRAAMLSDSGKVYMMLGHAAGASRLRSVPLPVERRETALVALTGRAAASISTPPLALASS